MKVEKSSLSLFSETFLIEFLKTARWKKDSFQVSHQFRKKYFNLQINLQGEEILIESFCTSYHRSKSGGSSSGRA